MSDPAKVIIYPSKDGRPDIQLRVEDGTVWLSQLEIAELFGSTVANVNIHIRNVLKEGELAADSVIKESLITAADGKRYKTKLYRLEMILAVGYRVKSPRGTQFRQWATANLSEYLVKGFVMNDERLKNPGGWDHFDELLACIRESVFRRSAFTRKSAIFSRSAPTTVTIPKPPASSLPRRRTRCSTRSPGKPPPRSSGPGRSCAAQHGVAGVERFPRAEARCHRRQELPYT